MQTAVVPAAQASSSKGSRPLLHLAVGIRGAAVVVGVQDIMPYDDVDGRFIMPSAPSGWRPAR